VLSRTFSRTAEPSSMSSAWSRRATSIRRAGTWLVRAAMRRGEVAPILPGPPPCHLRRILRARLAGSPERTGAAGGRPFPVKPLRRTMGSIAALARRPIARAMGISPPWLRKKPGCRVRCSRLRCRARLRCGGHPFCPSANRTSENGADGGPRIRNFVSYDRAR
jgi:hypothetical protein